MSTSAGKEEEKEEEKKCACFDPDCIGCKDPDNYVENLRKTCAVIWEQKLPVVMPISGAHVEYTFTIGLPKLLANLDEKKDWKPAELVIVGISGRTAGTILTYVTKALQQKKIPCQSKWVEGTILTVPGLAVTVKVHTLSKESMAMHLGNAFKVELEQPDIAFQLIWPDKSGSFHNESSQLSLDVSPADEEENEQTITPAPI